ncbi:hypothetical protein C8J56DRAFT_739985, partial [Mycena floridula]
YLTRIPWNIALILTTLLSATLSLSPYIYLIHSHARPFTAWGFPFLRGLGSFLATIAMQLSLQRRIHRIIRCRLLFMIINKDHCETLQKDEKLHWVDNSYFVEERLQELFKLKIHPRMAQNNNDIEMQQGTPTAADILCHHPKLTALVSTDWLLQLYQLTMAIGMLMIVVGY